jgi:Zn-dependent protease with chaperone function
LWVCPGCSGRFRLKKVRSGESSGETAPVAAPDPEENGGASPSGPIDAAEVGGFALAVRSHALRWVRWGYGAGTGLGVLVLLPLGGFVPVLSRWLDDRPMGWPGVVQALGGAWVGEETTDPDADLGPILAKVEAPRLFEDLGEIARRVGARRPAEVRLTYLPCCGVVASGKVGAMLIGLPLLQVLTRGELRAVLAHELAHLARGDASSSARSCRFVEGLGHALDSAVPARWSPLRLWAHACRGVSDRLVAPVARSQEVRADRASAQVAGGSAAAGALVKVALVQPLFREVLDHYDPNRGDLPNLYAFFREFWSRLPDGLNTSIRHGLLGDRRSGSGGVHPALLDRLGVVQSYADHGDPAAMGAPAASLVGDLEALEQFLHDRLFATGRVEPSVFHRAGS